MKIKFKMKKLILTITTCTLIFASSFSQVVYRSDSIEASYFYRELVKCDDGSITYESYMGFNDTQKPINGTYILYYENKIFSSVDYKNGIKHGVEKHFYSKDTTLKSYSEWENGKKHGKEITYFYPERVSGKLEKIKTENNFKDGLYWGWQRVYSEKGEILGEVNLIDGNGIFEVYSEQGKLKEISFFKKGVLLYNYSINEKGVSEDIGPRLQLRRTTHRRYSSERFKEGGEGLDESLRLGKTYRHYKFNRLKKIHFEYLRMKIEYYNNGYPKSVDIYGLDKKCFDKRGNIKNCKTIEEKKNKLDYNF